MQSSGLKSKSHSARSHQGRLAATCFLLVLFAGGPASAIAASGRNPAAVQSDATPQISKVTPVQAAVGSEVTIQIEGRNFSAGVYLSFSSPAVRVVATERLDASNLQARLQINPTAQPGAIRLYVSNPAGPAAETSFTILAAGSPPPEVTGSTNGSREKDPEVSSVTPPRAARGSQAQIKIKGKRFAEGAKVSFSNPGIHVLGMKSSKSSELTADIQVAADASLGETGLFVINPDDTEVEARFEVTEPASATTGAAKTSTVKKGTEKNVQASQSFQVFSLGGGISILQNPSKSKGTLTLAGGKLTYNEEGKGVFSVPVAEIKEVDVNSVFGVNTGTFHIILSSGKTYNFIAGSLRPPETQAIVDSLRHAMQ